MIKRYIGVSLVMAAMLAAGCSSSDDDNPAGTATAGTTTAGTTTAGTTTAGTTTAGTTTAGTTTAGTTTAGTTTEGTTTEGTTTEGTTTEGATTAGTTTAGTTTDGGTVGEGEIAADVAALQAFITNATAPDDEIWTCTQGSDSATGTRGYKFNAIADGATAGTGFRREVADGSNDLTFDWSITDNNEIAATFNSGGATGLVDTLQTIRITATPRSFTAFSDNLGTTLACTAEATTS